MAGNQITQLVEDRRSALLSMEKGKILAYAKKYGVSMPADDETFWIVVHKARTGDLSLPDEERQKSRDWLKERGYKSLG